MSVGIPWVPESRDLNPVRQSLGGHPLPRIVKCQNSSNDLSEQS